MTIQAYLYQGLSGASADAAYNLPINRNLKKQRCPNLTGPMSKCDDSYLTSKREELRVYYHNTYELFEKVFEPMNCDEAYTVPPIHKLRHPLIFYLGHTACFYINKLVIAGLTTRINPSFEKMFAIGVDEMSWDDLNEAHYDWPSVAEVWAYRKLVRDRMDELIRTMPLRLPIRFDDKAQDAFFWILSMGCEHERIHIETASVHIRELPLKYVTSHPFWAPAKATARSTSPSLAPKNELISIDGHANVSVGRPKDSPIYGWDCDFTDPQAFSVNDFHASKFLVSNAEFKEFIDDGGYTNLSYWDEEGKGWVEWKKPTHPWFWVKAADGSFLLRTQVEEIPLPWDWPVEVNNLEAFAFVNWKRAKSNKSIRLPTEAEWYRLFDLCVQKDMPSWGEKAPGNVNFEYGDASSVAVDSFPQGPLYDVVGNVWQHTCTPTYPYPGFSVHPVYDDFSAPTMDGRHYLQHGGAWISTGNEATRESRYAFRRHFFQMIGIRYVEGGETNEFKLLRNVLGMDPLVDTATALGYETHNVFGQKICYPKAVADVAVDIFKRASKTGNMNRSMDLFCGAGRVSFELGVHFKESVGVDRSARPLQCGFALKERGQFQYASLIEGNRRVARTVEIPEHLKYAVDNTTFYQCDATNLHGHLSNFDLIVAWNVIDQTYSPAKALTAISSRLSEGGVLVVISSYSMDETVTPKAEWLGATEVDDNRLPEDSVTQIMQSIGFEAWEHEAVPKKLTGYVPQTSRGGVLHESSILVFRK